MPQEKFHVDPWMTIGEFLQKMFCNGMTVAKFEQQLDGQPPIFILAIIGDDVQKVKGILKAHTNYFEGDAGGNGQSRSGLILPPGYK